VVAVAKTKFTPERVAEMQALGRFLGEPAGRRCHLGFDRQSFETTVPRLRHCNESVLPDDFQATEKPGAE